MRKYQPIVLTLAAVWFVSSQASAQPLRTLTVIDAVKFPPKARQAHDRLQAALEQTLSSDSWYLAEPRRAIDCGATVECLAEVARDNNTDYVLRLSGSRTQDDGYDVTVELYTSMTARTAQVGAYCDYCDLPRINQVISSSVLHILAGALKEEAALEAAKKAQPPAPPSGQPALPAPVLVSPPPTAGPGIVSWIPWSLIGVGAVTAGYGAWALYQDGATTGSCSETPTRTTCQHYTSRALGLGTMIGGGALVIAGTVWRLTRPTHTVAVVTSLHHVALNVRF